MALNPANSLAAQIADGVAQGIFDAAARNQDDLAVLATQLAQAWAAGLRALVTPTAIDAKAPAEQAAVIAEFADAEKPS